MLNKSTVKRPKTNARKKKSASTPGEFVHEEMKHNRKRKPGVRSTKPAIVSGLSKPKRAGVSSKPPKGAPVKTKKSVKSALEKGKRKAPVSKPVSKTRSTASKKPLKKGPVKAASRRSISRPVKSVSMKKTASHHPKTAKKSAPAKAAKKHSAAPKKAVKTAAPRKAVKSRQKKA